ncbi:MAG: domain S-box, partial [Chthoniobacteraceae bacterium]|nr:domain S-box [Chthoniobacteraceae bacterium]
TAYSVEYRIVWPDGSMRWIAARGRATFDAHGRPLRSIGTAHDITERKRIETQSLRAQRMESLGTLAGGIAHDLNNVFAPIVLAIGLLKLKFPDAESCNVLEMIEKSADRGVEMVRQVLAFARGIDGERFLVIPALLLEDVQRIIVDTFPKNIALTTEVGAGLWSLMGNATQLHQVLLNLCINARDAMSEGGQLVLSAENITLQSGNAVSDFGAPNGPYLLIKVRDNGEGIPSSILENIFDPFFTTKAFGKGTGLGLSTSLGIIKSHGGFIQVESEAGKGTTFKIYLPAAASHSATSTLSPGSSDYGLPPAEGELLLIIDDEAPIRDIGRKILENFGYTVITASNGADAIEQYHLHRSTIALVITDMMMPVMDGSTTIQRLREINPHLKIISTSGLPASEYDINEKYFLQKPYSQETILRTVSDALHSPA